MLSKLILLLLGVDEFNSSILGDGHCHVECTSHLITLNYSYETNFAFSVSVCARVHACMRVCICDYVHGSCIQLSFCESIAGIIQDVTKA